MIRISKLHTEVTKWVNMAYYPGVPGTHDVYPTIDDCYRVVHMGGKPTRQSMGLNSHRGEVSSYPDRPNVGTEHEEELCNTDMALVVEPGWTQGEPPLT